MNILTVIYGAFSAVVLLFALFVLLAATVFRKRWGHDIMGWHDCDGDGFDGVSMTGVCKYCGKSCLMDGQGNWF